MRACSIQVRGGTLETGWWGPAPADAPTLVLLHEGLGSVGLWRDVPERLAAATVGACSPTRGSATGIRTV
jgi:dienelactone hydrolase